MNSPFKHPPLYPCSSLIKTDALFLLKTYFFPGTCRAFAGNGNIINESAFLLPPLFCFLLFSLVFSYFLLIF
ncbi:hypothetical protein AOB57_012950 [Methanosarcina flavescens]|uniref:Uncharacterized protein n=1 Tax=Methanosarcina flavescens TaxID=1715806 RepID=A0A660HVT7_9EURY|nr:hypothetical protein AOB57_012950 [Methanosarcina flavescens]